MKKCIIYFSLFLSISSNIFAQSTNPDFYSSEKIAQQGKNDFLVVLAGGLGGAVLGLSTLSFVDEPEDHLDNILTGGAIGIIAGVIYVAYRQANVPSYFDEPSHQNRPVEDRTYTWRKNILKNKSNEVFKFHGPATLGFSTRF